MRSPATICPPACRAAVERDLAQRSSVTSTTPGMPGFSAKDANSRSCSLSMPPPTSMSRLRTDDMDSMASSSSTVTAPSVSRTSTTRSRMRILARSTSLARAAPIAASASWLGTTMIRYSTRSVLILSLPPRRFGSSVMNGSSVGSLWSIVGQSRVGPHHPRACGSGVSYHRDPAETSRSARSLERIEGCPTRRQDAGLSTSAASVSTIGTPQRSRHVNTRSRVALLYPRHSYRQALWSRW